MTNDFPTDPNAETIGLPSEDSAKGSMPEPGKFVTSGIPSEIGRYKILGVIGQGGMGAVYEAMQEAPRRRVALKIIKSSAASEMAMHRFQFESQTLAKLSHPNIAQIYEAGTWEHDGQEVPFFAMEYIPGAKGIVSYVQQRHLSLDERLGLYEKVCDAVHHAHQKGVIHRDLKPDNILVDSKVNPKIIDFGVARATDADLAVTTMQTTMGQLIGTLQYMSPEQCDADPELIDTRSDVYALGVILFQLLSGKLPYNLRKRAIHEAVRVIKEERPLSMKTINVTLKGDIDTITMKALEKDRTHRYQSAAELGNDVHRYLNSEPILARPLSISYQLRMFTKKYKRTCAAVMLLAVSVVLGIVGTSWGMIEANKQRARVEQRNIVLEDTVKSLFGGVKDVVQDLGDSAEAQRMLLDIARANLEAIQEGAEPTPRDQAELGELLLRNARSQLSVSGVGFGNVDAAESSMNEAKVVLEGIDASDASPELMGGVKRMLLDQKKYLAEAERTRAALEENSTVREQALQRAASIYRERYAAGKQYYETSGHLKGLDVQKSSMQGLGNVLVELGDTEGAEEAFETSLTHAELLLELDEPSKTTRRQRGVAIALYGLAKLSGSHNSKSALKQINRAIEISRIVLAKESSNVRRSRDLALMLALRGDLQLEEKSFDEGIEDYRESSKLLTKRAVESPRELASQQDLEGTITAIADSLEGVEKHSESNEILTLTIDQLECIASAEELAGRGEWTEILNRLQDRSDAIAVILMN